MMTMIATKKGIRELLKDIKSQERLDRYSIGRYDQNHLIRGDGKFYYDKQVEEFRKLVKENKVTDADYSKMYLTVAIIDAMTLGI